MKNFAYVVTDETSHNIVGVYTDFMLAINAIWHLSQGYNIVGFREDLIGCQYKVVNPETKYEVIYYIEKIEMNEKFWR